MNDYQPLPLGEWCNAGPEVFGEGSAPRTGAQSFHGLPFQIGSEPGNPCFLAFGAGQAAAAVTVPVGATARHILFAHVLLESKIEQGEPIGHVVAHYAFRWADGETAVVPVRERFEVAVVPTPWGQGPFRAVADNKDGLANRYHGDWGNSGQRQTEAHQGTPSHYYLWSWDNPRPEVAIESVEIRPGDRKFVLAAITLSHLEEEPFGREASREVLITLPEDADARKPFALEVDVDRGTATYPHALPAAEPQAFLDDPLKGWGETQNRRSSPAYVEVAASPSATVTVKNDGEELGRASWAELQAKGTLQAGPRLHLEVAGRAKSWVHTRILDDATGQPVPCRIHFRSARGIPYAPHGHHAHVNSNLGTWHIDIGGDVRLGQITYAYVDGTCQGWLPEGDLIVDVARGYEYEPLRARVTLAPGQRELTLRLKRWTDMNRQRYFSGDTHVHFLSTQGGETEARGEDLNVVNLLQSQWGHLFTNTEEFTGRPHVSADGRTIVYATQENRQHLLGHLTLLGLKAPVMPWCSDGPGEAELGGTLETTLSHWADECHRQGGTVVIPHVPNPNCEPAALIATGRADAVEFLIRNAYQHLEYYRYLNAGYRLPLTGGTDKMTSDVPVGIYRTYVYIPPDEEFTYDAWCKALRGGHTFLSAGPMLKLTVDGQPIGSTLDLPADGGAVEVEASAESALPIHTLQIVMNGEVVASTAAKDGTRTLALHERVRVAGHSWLAARCGGPEYHQTIAHHDGWGRGIMAHTSPVYVACGEPYNRFDLESARYMLTVIGGGLEYIRHRSRQHVPGTVAHHHGEADHQAYLERPFLEAQAALHRRMHELGIPH